MYKMEEIFKEFLTKSVDKYIPFWVNSSVV